MGLQEYKINVMICLETRCMKMSRYEWRCQRIGRRKFLLTSHAYLVQGMKSSLELILGEQECVDVVCAYTDGQYDIKVEIEKKLTALQPEDELIVIADLWHIDVRHYKLAI